MFCNEKNSEGNYDCYLCSGTFVSPEEQEFDHCKYTGELITEEYGSNRFWLLPFDYFFSKITQVENIVNFAQRTLNRETKLRQELASVLYSQLVTAIEVCLREQFKIGMESPKGFDNFVKGHVWDTKYYPNELNGNMKNIVNQEIEKINFQNFSQVGNAYKEAFKVDIFSFPEQLKCDINRILRFRHSLVHQDEIWEKGHLIKIDLPQIQQDMKIAQEFIGKIEAEFRKNIGVASDIKMTRVSLGAIEDDRPITNCQQCPLGLKFDDDVIFCYEGAYDGIGFGIEKSRWKNACKDMTFKEAIRQRKILGEEGLISLRQPGKVQQCA